MSSYQRYDYSRESKRRYPRTGHSLVTAATADPVSLFEVKEHLRITHDDQDQQLTDWITAATAYVQNLSGRQLVTATWKMTLDCFPVTPDPIYLPRPPVQSVTHVKYYNQAGTLTTWDSSDYTVDLNTEPARIQPDYQTYYPTYQERIGAVEIQYVCGYGAASAVPYTYKQAIKMLVGHWYLSREGIAIRSVTKEIELGIKELLQCESWGSYLGRAI
jgi:uncharacterized phiE125 gp8 family phage protein